jgi:hypothetical protein
LTQTFSSPTVGLIFVFVVIPVGSDELRLAGELEKALLHLVLPQHRIIASLLPYSGKIGQFIL